MKTLIPTITIYSQDIELEFGIEKSTKLIMWRGKSQTREGVELLNQEKQIRTVGEMENYKYLALLEEDNDQTSNDERKKRTIEYLIRTGKQLETKFCNRNLKKEINTCAVLFVLYSEPFLEWTKE